MTDAAISPIRLSEPADDRQSSGLWRDAFSRLRRHRLAMLGLVFLIITIIMAVFGPNLAAYAPEKMDFKVRFAPPSLSHPFGTDDFGRDTFTRIVYGARVSLEVGIISVSLAATVGTLLGLLAGYGRRLTDEVIMRMMDVLYAFPAVLLAIAILAALGKGVGNAMIAIGIVYIPIFARITRGEVLSIRNEEFITAARSMGATDTRILLRHILPNILFHVF